MAVLLVQLLTALAAASSLFLVAAGLTVTFGVTRIANFAHGSLTMLGAYIGWTLLSLTSRDPAWFAAGVVGTATITAALGAMMEVGLLRRLYRAPDLLQLLATFGVALIVQDAVLHLWGPADLALSRPPWMRGFVTIAGERFPLYDLVSIAIAPCVLAALWVAFARTRWGMLVRAATEDRDMVAALGIDQRGLFTSVLAVGAGLAGLGGVLALPDGSANLQIDFAVVTDAFVVVVVGGLGSIGGAFAASVLIAVLRTFGILLLPKATLVMAFALMALVLVVRPNGLFGQVALPSRALAIGGPVRPASLPLRLFAAVLLAVAVAAPLAMGPFALAIMTEMLIAILFAASLHFAMGAGGMASFGHAAWFGLGAYGAALASKTWAMPMPAAVAIAPLLAGSVAAAVGWFVVRLSGVYLAMLTLAFAQIVWAGVIAARETTGGDDGLLGIWPDAWAADPRVFYALALVTCAGGAMLLRRLVHAPFGLILRATRDAPARAEALGIDVGSVRLAAFVVAGAAAGLAGAMATYSKGSVFPTAVSIGHSVDALVMVLLGGLRTLAGPIVGAIAYTGLSDVLLSATQWWRAILGAGIIAMVLAFPDGIAGGFGRGMERVWRS